MHIEEQDCLEVFYYLGYEQERGMEWMLYDEENGSVIVPGIFCFPTEGEMLDFKQQYPAFANNFKGTSIEPILDAMSEVLELNEGKRQARAVDIKVTDCKLDRPARQDAKPRHNLLLRKVNNNANVHVRRHIWQGL